MELRKAKKRLAVQRDSKWEEVFRVWFQVGTKVAMQKEDPVTLAHPLKSDHYACVDNDSFDDVHFFPPSLAAAGPECHHVALERKWTAAAAQPSKLERPGNTLTPPP